MFTEGGRWFSERTFVGEPGERQGCELRGSRGSRRTPSHPVEDPFELGPSLSR